MDWQQSVYRFFIYPLTFFCFSILRLANSKIAEGFRLRKSTPWLSTPPNLQPLWFHCASGEFEYAKPVIRQLKSQYPEQKIMVTYFSPSVQKSIASNSDVDLFFPLPWDKPKSIKEFLQHHSPQCLAIARTDLWPELLHQTSKFGIPSLLFSKTFNTEKGFFANHWDRFSHRSLDITFVVSESDKLEQDKIQPPSRVLVKGDTRYDQCLHRFSHPRWTSAPPAATNMPVVILGSTWSADENVVLPTVIDLHKNFLFMVVPHEPTPAHIQSLEKTFKQAGVSSHLFSQNPTLIVGEVLIVDQVGILADLYSWCDFAYVGGSFDRGVHSVMEPLAQGKPCFVGPKNKNSREVQEFKTLKTALPAVVEIHSTEDFKKELVRYGDSWTADDTETIRSHFHQRTGSSKNVVLWIQEAIHKRSPGVPVS